MTSCTIAWVLVLVLLPLIVIWNITESRSTKINRARSNGSTWVAIAKRYSVSATTVRRWSMA